jgi:hypothetical protein
MGVVTNNRLVLLKYIIHKPALIPHSNEDTEMEAVVTGITA